MTTVPDQFYTGLVASAYAPLRGVVAPAEPYERFVRRFGEPGLEIGCGHGEPLLDLVAAGLDVTGLDSSADMLTLCATAAQCRGLDVELVCQPMQVMSIDRRFRSIYFAGPTFQLVVDDSTAAATLRCIFLHLDKDGRVLVPLFLPMPTVPEVIGVWREHTSETGEVLAVRVVGESYRASERRVDSTLQYRRGPEDNPTDLVERVWSLRWYENDEFANLAGQAGLAVERVIDHGSSGLSYILKRAA